MIHIVSEKPEEYQRQLNEKVSEYLRTYFYDGPYDERILMSNVMREGRGQLNPNQVLPIIKAFLECETKFLFNYQG